MTIPKSRTVAFSLIELLVVVAVMGILAALALPAFVSIARGTGMKRAVSSLSDAMDLARSEAMARSSWVWVGLQETTNSTGGLQVLVSIAASKDGTTNSATGNLYLPVRPFTIGDIKLLAAPSKWGSNVTVVKDSDFTFTATVSGKPVTFAGQVIAFSPQGEALLKFSQISPWLEIGIRETRGTREIPDREASIRIAGPSGQTMTTY